MGRSNDGAARSDALVLFGVTGDFTHKMIFFPALHAMTGDGALFTPEDAVEAAWAVVDPVLKDLHRVRTCKSGSWGPKEADALIAAGGRWHNPVPERV